MCTTGSEIDDCQCARIFWVTGPNHIRFVLNKTGKNDESREGENPPYFFTHNSPNSQVKCVSWCALIFKGEYEIRPQPTNVYLYTRHTQKFVNPHIRPLNQVYTST
jgi:hypothetical protein